MVFKSQKAMPKFEGSKKEVIPEIKKEYKKPDSASDIIFRKANVIIESSGSNLSYMIFAFQKVFEKYDVDYEKVLCLMYLEELGIFEYTIEILNKKMWLVEYVRSGLIIEEYLHDQKRMFKLSPLALEILKSVKSTLGDCDSFVGKNRILDVQTDDKVKSVLSDYWDLITPV